MDTPKKELALPKEKAVMTMSNWQMMKEQCEAAVKSRFIPVSIKTPEQAMAIGMMGKELGMGLMSSLQLINIIQGRMTISPKGMLGLVMRKGLLENIDYDVTNERAVVTVKRKGVESVHKETFGIEEAKKMQLWGKDNYNKQPGTMFKWRALSLALNALFPDVLNGMFTPEEMGANVQITEDEDVVVVDSLPVAIPQPQEEKKNDLKSAITEIEDRLFIAGQGEAERMSYILMELTKHKDGKGEDEWIELDELSKMTEQHPGWIVALLSKMRDQKVGDKKTAGEKS